MAVQIQLRRDTAANWTSENPTLAEGEVGFETDTNQAKIGDGSTAWTGLDYFGGDDTALAAHIADTSDAHDASAISVVSTTLTGTGTDVQAVLEELDNAIDDHVADSSAAHAATAISFSPDGSIAATTVQAAVQEVRDEAQPLDSDLTTIAGLTATTDNFIQSKSSAWASRTPAQVLADLAAVGTTFQPLDSDLTAIAGLTATTDNFLQAKSSAWASRTPAQVLADLAAVGTTFQPLDSDLTSIAALTTTSFGRSVLDRANAAALATLAGVGTGDSPTLTALTLSNGQIAFPASQNASAGANTLDDYEEGTFTPVFSFATVGTLSATHTVQSGKYTKIGNVVMFSFHLTLSAMTKGTSSGAFRLTGLPFTVGTAYGNAMLFAGWTKAGYTDCSLRPVAGQTYAEVVLSGSGNAEATLDNSDTFTGANVVMRCSGIYFV